MLWKIFIVSQHSWKFLSMFQKVAYGLVQPVSNSFHLTLLNLDIEVEKHLKLINGGSRGFGLRMDQEWRHIIHALARKPT